jgi:hypothetical protein
MSIIIVLPYYSVFIVVGLAMMWFVMRKYRAAVR